MINEYSKALFELAIEENQLEFVKESFDCFSNIYSSDSDFKKILESPKIKNSDKKDIIKNSFNSCSSTFLKFVYVVIDNQRVNILDEIYSDFLVLYRENHKIKLVEVYSKSELSETEKKKINSALETIYHGYKVEINNHIDEKLIGGYHIIANGKSLDLSILNQINNLKESI